MQRSEWGDWADIKKYAESVIPVIRKYAENALIIVGTPNYSSNLNGALLNPLPYDNVMYAYEEAAASIRSRWTARVGHALARIADQLRTALTMLARQADTDTTGGTTWYEKTQIWAKKTDISDGSNPNGNISRAEMVTMLWRAAGSPKTQAVSRTFPLPATTLRLSRGPSRTASPQVSATESSPRM